jgi:hypothetical protein
MGGGENNKVYHNNLIDNGDGSGQACSMWTFENEWDDGYPSGGNYWRDYNGTDNDGDGIGDTPYEILVFLYGYNDYDFYPVMEPFDDDTYPPVTQISFNPSNPNGENGWYISDVTITLLAKDYLSGINATYYRVNEGVWEIYESPFIISEEGDDILIEYYSDDIFGNVEDVKSTTLDIDKTPPNMTVEWDVEKIGWRKWLISFTITIIDNTSGSSIDRLEIFMNEGLQTVIPGSGPTYGWSVVIFGDAPVDFKFIAYDTAGNYAVVEVTSTEISYHNRIKDIFTQQSINPLVLRLLERFPLIERFLTTIQRSSK